MDVRVPLLCVRKEDFTSEEAAEILTSYNAQSNALVIDVSIVAELYYLRVLSSDGKDVL